MLGFHFGGIAHGDQSSHVLTLHDKGLAIDTSDRWMPDLGPICNFHMIQGDSILR